jgi:transposase InsO family protein
LTHTLHDWVKQHEIEPSVRNRGDSYDNALAETINEI